MEHYRAPDDARTSRPREQSRARDPGSDRLRRAAGRPHRVRGLWLGQSTDRVRAAMADRPFAHLEGADPGLRAPAPRRRLGQPRQRPLRSAARPARPHDPGTDRQPRARSMDAAEVPAAVLVGLSSASGPMVVLASEHPERVLGLVFVCPAAPIGEPGRFAEIVFEERLETDHRWAKENIHFWRRDYRAYLEFFFSQAFPEAHSTKQFEDGVGWGLETDPESLAATKRAPPTVDLDTFTTDVCVDPRAGAGHPGHRRAAQPPDAGRRARTARSRAPGRAASRAAGTWSMLEIRSASTCSSVSSSNREGEKSDDTAMKTHPVLRVRDASRARYPDEEGYAEGDGVRLFFEVYGAGEPNNESSSMPSSPIVPLEAMEGRDPLPQPPLPLSP